MDSLIKRLGLCAAVLLGTAFCAAPGAKAGTVLDLITFSAIGFIPGGAPVDPVTGSFGIIFDPTLSYPTSTPGIVVFSPLNINIGPAEFLYSASSDTLVIGGTVNATDGVSSNSDDFALQITNYTTAPYLATFLYSQVGKSLYINGPGQGTVQIQRLAPQVVVATTPIPGSLLLLASALLGLAGFAYHQRRPIPSLPSPC